MYGPDTHTGQTFLHEDRFIPFSTQRFTITIYFHPAVFFSSFVSVERDWLFRFRRYDVNSSPRHCNSSFTTSSTSPIEYLTKYMGTFPQEDRRTSEEIVPGSNSIYRDRKKQTNTSPLTYADIVSHSDILLKTQKSENNSTGCLKRRL